MYSIVSSFLSIPSSGSNTTVTYLACALTVIVFTVIIDAVVRLFGRILGRK